MKKTMTQEDRDLAAAGYEHLEEQKAKKGAGAAEFDNVDIEEHHLPISGYTEALQTSIDTKDAANSSGLTSEEAKARLERFGQNVLTPPPKKSALRKVDLISIFRGLLYVDITHSTLTAWRQCSTSF
jgi:Cation transporter/ATPase, N-terminus.